jgi:hypothetical protein
MTSYPTLWSFFGGYLHEDWHDDYADEWAALDEFLADAPDQASGFVAEAKRLLSIALTEAELREVVLDELASYIALEETDWTYRSWLEALADRAGRRVGHAGAA